MFNAATRQQIYIGRIRIDDETPHKKNKTTISFRFNLHDLKLSSFVHNILNVIITAKTTYENLIIGEIKNNEEPSMCRFNRSRNWIEKKKITTDSSGSTALSARHSCCRNSSHSYEETAEKAITVFREIFSSVKWKLVEFFRCGRAGELTE